MDFCLSVFWSVRNCVLRALIFVATVCGFSVNFIFLLINNCLMCNWNFCNVLLIVFVVNVLLFFNCGIIVVYFVAYTFSYSSCMRSFSGMLFGSCSWKFFFLCVLLDDMCVLFEDVVVVFIINVCEDVCLIV